jgi:hypothetical protein
MPSIEGLEVEIAISKGWLHEQLHVIDMNPAIVATLARRFPGIHTYGVSAGRACQRMASRGVMLSAANFDFTSCISMRLEEEVKLIADSGALDPTGTLFGMTVLRGREPNAYTKDLFRDWTNLEENRWVLDGINRIRPGGTNPLTCFDVARIGLALRPFCIGERTLAYMERVGAYASPPQTMLFFVVALIRLDEARRDDQRFINGVDLGRNYLRRREAFMEHTVCLSMKYLNALVGASQLADVVDEARRNLFEAQSVVAATMGENDPA